MSDNNLIAVITIPHQPDVRLAVNDDRTYWYVTRGMEPVGIFDNFTSAWVEVQNHVRYNSECIGWLPILHA